MKKIYTFLFSVLLTSAANAVAVGDIIEIKKSDSDWEKQIERFQTTDCPEAGGWAKQKENKENSIVFECAKNDLDEVSVSTKAIKNGDTCPPDRLPQNATAGKYEKQDDKFVCIPTACTDAYYLKDKACVEKTVTPEQVKELKDNADKMKAKENSLANKSLTAASIAATGIGGQKALAGMAEQNADKEAEADMRAYLATFACDYGQGKNIRGGQMGVQLPGGNELIAQYNEYKNLASDLSETKRALGMQPGIESEIILDKSDSGLYDNVGMKQSSGANISLSRALMDSDGADAAAWNAQKASSSQNVKTGAIMAGAGIVGGIVGDALINKNAPRERSAEINQKYADLLKSSAELKNKIEAVPVKATDKSGEEIDTKPAVTTVAAIVPTTDTETIPGTKPEPIPETPQEQETTAQQQVIVAQVVSIVQDTQPSDKEIIKKTLCEGNKCDDSGNVILDGVNFDFNKSSLKSDAIAQLKTVSESIKKILNDESLKHLDINIVVNGYTDNIGSTAVNNKLSLARAQSVKSELLNNNISSDIITANGMGKTNPIADNKTSTGRAKNRRVEIQVLGIEKNKLNQI